MSFEVSCHFWIHWILPRLRFPWIILVPSGEKCRACAQVGITVTTTATAPADLGGGGGSDGACPMGATFGGSAGVNHFESCIPNCSQTKK